MNRLPPSDDEQQRRVQEDIQRRINLILDTAATLYDLIEPGMTVEVFLEAPAIITPNAPKSMKRLIITRPMMCLEIKG